MKLRIIPLVYFVLTLNVSCSSVSNYKAMDKKMRNVSVRWFQSKTYEQLLISDFLKATDVRPARTMVITDIEIIEQLMKEIGELPIEGEKFKSFADETPYLLLEFKSAKVTDRVEFYHGLIKTPATSFYASSIPAEKEVFERIQSILSNQK